MPPVSSNTESEIQNIENVAGTVGGIAGAVGGEAGQIADLAIKGAETVANSVEADQAAGHLTAVQETADAAQKLIALAPSASAVLPASTAAKITAAAAHASGLLGMLEEIGSEIKDLF